MTNPAEVGEGILPHYTESGDWRDEALCREKGNEIFFAQLRRGQSQKAIKQKTDSAKALCQQCPVRLNCLNYALKNFMRHGIWGGVEFDKLKTIERGELLVSLKDFD